MEQDKNVVISRLESEKSFEITQQHSDRRARARQLTVLRNCLFGKKRYQILQLTCSVSNFFNALRIAKVLNSKVPDMAMIIRFVPVVIIEVYEDGTSKNITRTKIQVKLTTKPTQDDKQQPGYNPGLPKDQIQDPIENVLPRRQFNKDRPNRRPEQQRQGRGRPQGQTRAYRKNKNDELSDQEQERRHDNRRPQGHDRERRQQNTRYVPKSRGGSRGVGQQRRN